MVMVAVMMMMMEVVANMTIKLGRTFSCASIGGSVHSFLLGTDPGVELPGHRTGTRLVLVDGAKQLSKKKKKRYLHVMYEFQMLHIPIDTQAVSIRFANVAQVPRSLAYRGDNKNWLNECSV